VAWLTVPKCPDTSDPPEQCRSVSVPNCLGSEVSGYPLICTNLHLWIFKYRHDVRFLWIFHCFFVTKQDASFQMNMPVVMSLSELCHHIQLVTIVKIAFNYISIYTLLMFSVTAHLPRCTMYASTLRLSAALRLCTYFVPCTGTNYIHGCSLLISLSPLQQPFDRIATGYVHSGEIKIFKYGICRTEKKKSLRT